MSNPPQAIRPPGSWWRPIRAALQPTFTLDTTHIEARLRRRLSLPETFAIFFCIGLSIMLIVIARSTAMPLASDFDTFLKAPTSNYHEFYYAYWSLPVFDFLGRSLNHDVALLVWNIINIVGVWFAARVFGGSATIALLNYQMFYTLFYGQVSGVIAAGLALMWWGLARRRPFAAGLGLTLALVKFHIGIPIGLALLLLARTSWYDRLRCGLVPLVAVLISLLLYPYWVLNLLEKLIVEPPITFGSIALMPLLGLGVLLLWLPPLLLRRSPGRRLAALMAASALAVPYYQHTGLVTLAVLPLGGLPLLGNVGFLYAWLGEPAFLLIAMMPLTVYVWALSKRA